MDNKIRTGLKPSLERLAKLQALLVSELDPRSISERPTVAFKVASLRHAICHRVADLGEVACELLSRDLPLHATILTRALFESAATLVNLCSRVERCLEEPAVKDLDEFVMRGLFGSRIAEAPVSAPSVLTTIQAVENRLPGTLGIYNHASEIVHPNFFGLLGYYGGDVDTQTLVTRFDGPDEIARHSTALLGVGLLDSGLVMCLEYGEALDALLPRLVALELG